MEKFLDFLDDKDILFNWQPLEKVASDVDVSAYLHSMRLPASAAVHASM